MQFDSWQAFWDMGGYGLFVWLSYGAFIVSLIGLWAIFKIHRRSIFKQIDVEKRRRERIAAAKAGTNQP